MSKPVIKIENKEGGEEGPFSIKKLKPKNNSYYHKIGHWSEKENIKYYAFLKRFQGMFDEREMRREWKVFKALSEFMKTRNPNQCRSHHHKMQKDFPNIKQTLQSLEIKMPGIQNKAKKYTQKLNQVSFLTIANNQYKATEIPNDNKDAVDFKIKKQTIYTKKTGDNYDEAEENIQKEQIISQEKVSTFFNQKQKDLAECHEYFMRWWTKLNFLMSFGEGAP